MADAHQAEYHAAVEGMNDTYGSPARRLPTVGEHVRGTTCGKAFSGEAVEVTEHRVTVGIDMAYLSVDPSELELD